MHRAFSYAIAPLLPALRPQTIVEVGAGHGRLTRRLLRETTAAHVHAVDPSPGPGLTAQARQEPRLTLHHGTGVRVLPLLAGADLAVLDGDPNFASLRSELEIIRAWDPSTSERSPVVVVQNVLWPFGRRDGFYEPPLSEDGVVAAGVEPGRPDPVADGLRLVPFVRRQEGGPRNGVLVAVEQWVAEMPGRWRVVVLPGFGGTAVLAPVARISARPALGAAMAWLASAEAVTLATRRVEAERLAAEVRVERSVSVRQELREARAQAGRRERELRKSVGEAEVALDREREHVVELRERARTDASVAHAVERRLELAEGQARESTASLAEASATAAKLRDALERQKAVAAELAIAAGATLDGVLERQKAVAAEQASAAARELRRTDQLVGERDELQRGLEALRGELAAARQEADEQRQAERISSGRVLHLRDTLDAATEDRDRAQAELGVLQPRLASLEEAVAASSGLLVEIGAARHLRFVAAVRRFLGRGDRGSVADIRRSRELLEAGASHLPDAVEAESPVEAGKKPVPR